MHPDPDTIERFVMGALDDAALTTHFAECEACAEKLQEEAEREVAMLAVRHRAAEARVLQPVAKKQSSPVIALRVTALAAAAALLLFAGRQLRHSRLVLTQESAARVVSCPDGAKQLACIAEAHRSGGRLEYPTDPGLAALGIEPGLTTFIELRGSEGVIPELEPYLTQANVNLKTCAAQTIVTQSAPIQTGQLRIRFTVAPNGRVEEEDTSIAVDPQIVDGEDPSIALNMALRKCMSKTTRVYPFEGGASPVRVVLIAKYVWRE